MAVDFARRVMPILQRLVLSRVPPGSPVLDLCCGSGRITAALVEHGFPTTGVDASEAMLRLARCHAPAAEFYLADARTLVRRRSYAAVVSTFNSLAHVHTVGDLIRVLRNAQAALAPGGRLLFDLSMHDHYQRFWRGSFSFAGAEGACVIRPSYDPDRRLACNEIRIFPNRRNPAHAGLLSSGNLVETENPETRSFTIFQKCHSESDVRQALAAAGFERVESFDAQRDLGMAGESDRRFFLARRG